jgi:predicted TIM-barrel fold metal-dependent hydrolase
VFIGSDAHRPKYWPESFVRFINSWGQDKVIFGTDFPIIDFQRAIDDIAALGLKPDVQRKFLRENVRRVYGLTD